MTEIFTAKTVEEAKAMAVKKFGKKASEIKFEVLEEGRKGFLGIGQVDAKVKATYIAPLHKAEPKKEPIAKPISKPEPIQETKPEPVQETKPEPVQETKPEPMQETKPEQVQEIKPEPTVETVETVETVVESVETVVESVETVVESVEKPVEKSVEKPKQADTEAENADISLDDFELIKDEAQIHAKVKIAVDYIKSILSAMGIETEYDIYQNESGAVIDIKSNNNGTIIGRRGETLDSIQYLCSIIANKGDNDYFRITIDCLGYRSKRKETLKQLAAKVAKSVIRSGRSQQLEPMNPYERRVIHSTISEIEGVSSRSVGEEPYRKIIIVPDNPRNGKRRGNSNRRNDSKRGDRRGAKAPAEVKSIDISTSFEKDYKKPKPEDTMTDGLYGKIEF